MMMMMVMMVMMEMILAKLKRRVDGDTLRCSVVCTNVNV